jgi:hypothetical protein
MQAPSAATDTSRATAHLPGLDIEITHRRAAEGDAEHISINLKAVPSFDEFARTFGFGAANPFALWMRSVELIWLPWIEASRAMALPWTQAPSLAPPDSEAGSERKDKAPG